MRAVFILGAFMLIQYPVVAFDLPYKQLKKSYEMNRNQTLDKAERWIKWLPKNPAGYYFASLIHFENAQQERTVRQQYRGLSKALTYAKKLEQYGDDIFFQKVSWDTLTPHLGVFSISVADKLEKENLNQLATVLHRKRRHFESVESNEQTLNDVSEEHVPPASNFSEGQYFGVPSGMEIVESYSITSEKEMLNHINAARKKKGMEPLVWSEELAHAARYHAFDMGSQGYFDHDSFDRKSGRLKKVTGTFSRIRAFYSDSFVNSENIAAGNEGAYDTYMQWYNSKGHYENMFNPSSAKIGIGVCYVPDSAYGYYWVMCTAL
jgi:uncharacterized protein YkwD